MKMVKGYFIVGLLVQINVHVKNGFNAFIGMIETHLPSPGKRIAVYYVQHKLMMSCSLTCHEKTTLDKNLFVNIGHILICFRGNITGNNLAKNIMYQVWMNQDNKLFEGRYNFVYFSATCSRKYVF